MWTDLTECASGLDLSVGGADAYSPLQNASGSWGSVPLAGMILFPCYVGGVTRRFI